MNCMGDDKEIKGAESKDKQREEESKETDTPTSLNVDEQSPLTPVKSVTPLFGRKSRINCIGDDKEVKGAESKDREEESNETDTPTSFKRDPAIQRARWSCNKKLSPEMSNELKDHKSRGNEQETPRRRRKVEDTRRSIRRIHHDDEERELTGYPSSDEIEENEEKDQTKKEEDGGRERRRTLENTRRSRRRIHHDDEEEELTGYPSNDEIEENEEKDQTKKKEDGGRGRRRKLENTRRSRRRIHHDDEEQELTGYTSDDAIEENEEKEEKDQRKKKEDGGRGSANPILISVSKKYGLRPKFVARFARKIHVRGRGRFFCENENHEKITWTSEQTWMLINLETMSVMKRYKQKCKDCKEWTIPSVPRMEFRDMCHIGIRKYFKKVVQPLSKPANKDIVEDGNHVRDLCERCLELGKSCIQLDY